MVRNGLQLFRIVESIMKGVKSWLTLSVAYAPLPVPAAKVPPVAEALFSLVNTPLVQRNVSWKQGSSGKSLWKILQHIIKARRRNRTGSLWPCSFQCLFWLVAIEGPLEGKLEAPAQIDCLHDKLLCKALLDEMQTVLAHLVKNTLKL